MKTYTPGYAGTKLFFVFVGLAVVVVGLASVYQPLVLLATGQRASAEITAVIVSRPGEPDRILTSKDDVKPDSARTATFHFRARYKVDGSYRTGILSTAYHATPNNTIGDRFTVGYDPARPEELVTIYDLSTWTFGAFLVFTGAFLAVVQGIYLFYARRPIPIPDEKPAAAAAVS